jgi:hypothetical protein
MSRKIRTVTSYRSEIGNFESSSGSRPPYRYRYVEMTEDGKVLFEAEQLPNGKDDLRVWHVYDNLGNMVEKETWFAQENTYEKTVFIYNDKGEKVEEVHMFDNEPYEHLIFKYDDKANVVEESKYDEEGNLLEKQLNEYDNKGNVILQQLFEGEELSQEVTLEYNEASLCVKEINTKAAEGRKEITTYIYNDQGKKTRSETRDQKGNILGYVEVEYDEKGNAYRYTSETVGFYPTKMVNQVVFDDEGRAIESEYYDVLNGYMLSKETLSYDEEGNIRQQDIFEINPQQEMKKTHYSLQLVYEYFPETEEIEKA